MPASSTSDVPARARGPRTTAAPLLASLAGGAGLIALEKFGLLSPVGLGLVLGGGGAALMWALLHAPAIVAVMPAVLIPNRLIGLVFPYELALMLSGAIVLVTGWVRRERWLHEFTRLELVLLAFVAWAMFSGFWCDDTTRYLLGVRRLGFCVFALWVGGRLATLVPRAIFHGSLVASAFTISFATISKRLQTGYTPDQAFLSRGTATDLEWGWANYIAAVLLLLTPFVVSAILQREHRALRWVALATAPLLVTVQLIVLARGALVLFMLAVLGQLAATGSRGRLRRVGFGVLVVALMLVGPWGESFIARFTSLRELGSGTIRLWYFREGFIRVIDNLPWGIGLGQGYLYPDKLHGLDPHNYWLTLGGDLGVVGPLLWLAVLVMAWRAIRRVARTPAYADAGLALTLVFIASQAHTMLEPTFQGTQYSFLFFWMIGYWSASAALTGASERTAE